MWCRRALGETTLGRYKALVSASEPAAWRLNAPRARPIGVAVLHSCSGCFRLERLPGGACTHWGKAPPFHGARQHRTLADSDSYLADVPRASS
jgi:hypothetical protein